MKGAKIPPLRREAVALYLQNMDAPKRPPHGDRYTAAKGGKKVVSSIRTGQAEALSRSLAAFIGS